jgi:hypothetical protein
MSAKNSWPFGVSFAIIAVLFFKVVGLALGEQAVACFVV